MSLLHEVGMIRMIYNVTWATCLECILLIFFNIFLKIVGIVKSYFIKNVWKTILFKYRKIPKVSLRAYIFQRPFLGGLLLEGLTFGRAYLQREICVSKSIGLALQLEVNLPFLLCFTLCLMVILQVQAPGSRGGSYIWRGYLTKGFLHYRFGGLIHGGAYNFRIIRGTYLSQDSFSFTMPIPRSYINIVDTTFYCMVNNFNRFQLIGFSKNTSKWWRSWHDK